MNRLQKKCLIVSLSLHLLLVLVVVVGPGFMSSERQTENLQLVDFTPVIMTDDNVVGGGNPNARPPAPAPVTHATPTPPVRATPPPPEPKSEPKVTEPEAEPAKNVKPQPDSLEPSAPKKRTLNIPTTLKPRSRTASHAHSRANEEAQEREQAAEQQRLARLFADAARDIGRNTAKPTAIEDVQFGPGGGGPTYAGYAAWIQTVYLTAWVPPDEPSVDSGVAYASITIARDGTILSATLVSKSGDSQIDASVRRTLERVTTIGRPFPEGVKDQERTYKLKFDLKAKRGMA
jgi:outer membrane biosynthesis protein TonB